MNNIDIASLVEFVYEKSNGGQVTKEEYLYVASHLGDVNFLVFGTGCDSESLYEF